MPYPFFFEEVSMKKTITINTNSWKNYFQGNHGKVFAGPVILTLIIAAVIWYFLLPPLNLKSAAFWALIFCLLFIYIFLAGLWGTAKKQRPALKIPLLAVTVWVCAFLIMALFGARVFHAKKYSEILKVQEASIDIIPSVSGSSSIALMDTASAERLGDRRIGSLSDVVSQFNVGSYVQINYKDAPVKVAPLAYDGFFKWNANRKNGIPGYVLVNPVDMSADYVALSAKMHYVPSAYFGDNLERKIRFAYPAAMFGNLHFEIDEEGNPKYVASVYDHSIGLFGGTIVSGAIIVDPVTGEMERYSSGEVPQWADVVFEGDLICTQYNDYAQLRHGFFNSIFSQTDCRQITTLETQDEDGDSRRYQDYGYIAKDGDIWIYTGVTSVNGDSSNIGFILANERTSETKFVACAGADEFSGMKSAEGEVQEKGYTASFPSLINVEGKPTYIMVLKDANGLVKMYAAVDVEQYNTVVTAATQAECLDRYRNLVSGGVPSDTSAFETKTVTIRRIETMDHDGNTWIYIVDTDNNIYRAQYINVLEMLLVNEGDTIEISTDGTLFTLK